MAMFACWSTFLVRKKKKSKGFPNVADGSDKGSSNGDLRVKPIDLVSPSADEAYEGGDEHDGNRSMKKQNSDLDLQPKGELASHLSNPNLNSYVFEKASEALIASGHVSDPGIERKAFLDSPVLKRSCSNIETKRAKQWIKSPKRSSSYSNLENLPGNGGFQIRCENHSSPLSLRSSCSADRVMLKRRSSSQVLPSRSRKIWWKLFLWSHRNLHKPTDSRRQISVLRASKQKEGYSSDTHEPGQKLDEDNRKMMESANQWVAFSLGFSHMDRVNAWVNSLEDCDGIEDEQTGNLDRMEIEESSEKVCSHISHRAAEDEAQANSIIQSLNAFSSVAHISGIGLKAIPSISAFVCLRSVNLSGNSIVHIASGSLPKSLHTLDLSRNRISTVEGLRDLERLRVLNLSYNRITRIGHGLSSCTVIRELYLAGNKISNVEGLHRLLKLTVLDLSFNKLTTAKALGQLVANYNSLLALNLLGNPIQTNIGDDQLKKAVLSLLPHVTYLNKQLIKPRRVREVVTKSVAKAALGDVGRTSRRKLTRRLSQGLGSAAISRVGEGSFRAIKHGKSRHSTSGRR